ncbi:hypothetical protein [Aeoliella mucimassa]|uniref:Uncharacterized protein n=1 Tax=Aeoliella mucimassa TaxID=2527972 RepID=A0A518ATP6_9BACT|nr:hypothetical protein [Aeoliella mucimassa]QDU58103.1 hypothetical protein Pan181_43290 [Aeoliella mucimassa]
MRLFDEAGRSVSSPSAADVRSVIEGIDSEINTYAILEKQPNHYMQTMQFEDGFELEYQVDDTDHHFRAPQRMARDEVMRAMTQYAEQDDRWLKEIEWEPLNLEVAESKSGCLGLLLVGASLGASAFGAFCL